MSQQPYEWQPTNPPVPPPPRQSWFARNKVLAVILGLTVAIVLGCCAAGIAGLSGDSGSASDTATASTTDDTGAGTGTEEAAGSSKSSSKDSSKGSSSETSATSASKAPDSRPGIGAPARDGKFEFTVTKVEDGVSEVGSEFLKETADGQFVLVHISVKNIGDESQTLFDSEQQLKDAQGRSFSTDSGASISMPDNDVWINEINPGNTASGVLVYDMPADAEPTEIELHDSMFSGGVTVALK